jgi:hypothetical protein
MKNINLCFCLLSPRIEQLPRVFGAAQCGKARNRTFDSFAIAANVANSTIGYPVQSDAEDIKSSPASDDRRA